MPKFGLTMESGIITQWFKKEGDPVKKGEVLFEVQTEKILNQVESYYDGILSKILVKEGEEARVGQTVALIANADEIAGKIEVAQPAATVQQAQKPTSFVLATPAAKRIAKEKGIDLSLVKGSGKDGLITEKDVLDYLSEHAQGEEIREYVDEKISPMRKEISDRLSRTYFSSVLVTNCTKVNFSNVMNFKKNNPGVSVTAILIKVLALVLKEYPSFNAWFDGMTLKKFNSVNIGVAVDTDRGLVVPVIKQVEKLSLGEINAALNELAEKARSGKLTQQDISDSHFTVSNLGMYRTEFFTPVLNGNEVAILGVGRTVKELVAWDDGDGFKVQDVCHLSLSYDHRVIDGAVAARFLTRLCELIENKELFEKTVRS